MVSLRMLKYFIIFFSILSVLCCRKPEKSHINLDEEIDLNTENTIITTKQQKVIQQYGVVTVNRLRIRASNDIHAKTLRYVDTGQILNILYKDENRVKINQDEGYWYKIEFEGIKGWVFGFFLQVYADYEDARFIAERLANPQLQEAPSREMPINLHLYFLYKGSVLQLQDYKIGKARRILTFNDVFIHKYFFHPRDTKMYYIGTYADGKNDQRNLFVYNFQDDSNLLIMDNVYDCAFNFQDNKIALLGIIREKRRDFWELSIADIEPGRSKSSILKMRKHYDFEKNSFFKKLIEKELGALTKLSWDTQHNLVYMTLPDEEKTYIVSPETNDFITTLSSHEIEYAIDAHRLFMITDEVQDDRTIYTITLFNKATGMQKRIMSSHLIPLHFEASPDYNYAAITLVDLEKDEEVKVSSTSLLVLSLNSYSLIPISIEENTNQPRWNIRGFK